MILLILYLLIGISIHGGDVTPTGDSTSAGMSTRSRKKVAIPHFSEPAHQLSTVLRTGNARGPDPSSSTKLQTPRAMKRASHPSIQGQETSTPSSSGNSPDSSESTSPPLYSSPLAKRHRGQKSDETHEASPDGQVFSQRPAVVPMDVTEVPTAQASPDQKLVVKGISAVLRDGEKFNPEFLEGLVEDSQGEHTAKSPDIIFASISGHSMRNRGSFASYQPILRTVGAYRVVDSFLGQGVHTISFVLAKINSEDSPSSGTVTARYFPQKKKTPMPPRYRINDQLQNESCSYREYSRVLVQKTGASSVILGFVAMDAFWKGEDDLNLEDMVEEVYRSLGDVGPNQFTLVAGLFSPQSLRLNLNNLKKSDYSRISFESGEKIQLKDLDFPVPDIGSSKGLTWEYIARKYDEVSEFIEHGRLLNLTGKVPNFPPTFWVEISEIRSKFAWLNRILSTGDSYGVPKFVTTIGQNSFKADSRHLALPVTVDYEVDLSVLDKAQEVEFVPNNISFEVYKNGMNRIVGYNKDSNLKLVVLTLKQNDEKEYMDEEDWVEGKEFVYDPESKPFYGSGPTKEKRRSLKLPIDLIKITLKRRKKTILGRLTRRSGGNESWEDIGSTPFVTGKLKEKESIGISGKLFSNDAHYLGKVTVTVRPVYA